MQTADYYLMQQKVLSNKRRDTRKQEYSEDEAPSLSEHLFILEMYKRNY